MIVSRATAVLPVPRSPIISSRWPRPDGDHGIYSFDAGLQRLFDRLTLDNAGGAGFEQSKLGRDNRAFVVERLAQSVHDPAYQTLADGDLDDVAGALDRVALTDARFGAEQDRADIVFFEVQRHALYAAGELQQLADHAAFKAIDAGDAVTDLQNCSDAHFLGIGMIRLQLAFENGGNFLPA